MKNLPSCEDLPPCEDTQQCDVKYGPKTLDEYIDGMTKAIKESFLQLTKLAKKVIYILNMSNKIE